MRNLRSCSYFFWIRIFLGLWLMCFFVESALLLERFKFLAGVFGEVSPVLIPVLVGVGLAASVAFTAGIGVRVSAVALLAAMQLLIFAIPRFRIVVFPHISIMLVVTAIYYQSAGAFGIRSSLSDRRIWYLPLLFGVYAGFSISGISKFYFDLWNNGQMVGGQCSLSLIASIFGGDFCERLPLAAIAFIVASIEVVSLPLALSSRTRPFIWIVSTIMHMAIIFFVPQLPTRTGIFLMQLFLFDPDWLTKMRATFRGRMAP